MRSKLRIIVVEFVADVRASRGGKALRGLPDWALLTLLWVVGPVVVFGVLLAIVGWLDEFLDGSFRSILATALAVG